MKINLGMRAYGAAKAYLGYGLGLVGVVGFPTTQIVGGAALAIGKFIGKKNPVGNVLQRCGDALLTSPVSGAWFATEGLATLVTGENKVMGVKRVNSDGVEKVRGAGYIMTDVLPHMVKSVGRYFGITKQQDINPDIASEGDKGKSLAGDPSQNLTPTKTPKVKKFVIKTKGGR